MRRGRPLRSSPCLCPRRSARQQSATTLPASSPLCKSERPVADLACAGTFLIEYLVASLHVLSVHAMLSPSCRNSATCVSSQLQP